MVRGKLTNMRVLLQRANRDTDDPAVMQAVDQLKERLGAVAEAKASISSGVWRAPDQRSIWCVRQPAFKASGMRFIKRVRRPPTDPVNALLSFGYALLANDIHSAVNTVGFDPYQGYLHVRTLWPSVSGAGSHGGVPSPDRRFSRDDLHQQAHHWSWDFSVELGNVHRLTEAARRKFLMQYEERKNTEIQHPIFAYKASCQRCFDLQARLPMR